MKNIILKKLQGCKSDSIAEKLEELREQYPHLHITNLGDCGCFIQNRGGMNPQTYCLDVVDNLFELQENETLPSIKIKADVLKQYNLQEGDDNKSRQIHWPEEFYITSFKGGVFLADSHDGEFRTRSLKSAIDYIEESICEYESGLEDMCAELDCL